MLNKHSYKKINTPDDKSLSLVSTTLAEWL